MKKIFLWLLIIVVTFMAAGCGSKGSTAQSESVAPDVSVVFADQKAQDNGYGGTAVQAESKTEAGQPEGKRNTDTRGQSITGIVDSGQKVIFKGQIDLETLDFEKTITELTRYISSIGGYQQSSAVHGGKIGYDSVRSAEYVFRIPKKNYTQSFTDIKKFGTVVSEQSNGEDITDQYFDTEARVKSLKIQQERLLALLQKADKMEDILKIETELQNVLYQIENYTGTLKKWDSLVDYSTVSVNVREVEQITPVKEKQKGLFGRIAAGFTNSIDGLWDFTQNLLIFIASALPIILPLGIITYVIYRVIRKKYPKKVKKVEEKKETEE